MQQNATQRTYYVALGKSYSFSIYWLICAIYSIHWPCEVAPLAQHSWDSRLFFFVQYDQSSSCQSSFWTGADLVFAYFCAEFLCRDISIASRICTRSSHSSCKFWPPRRTINPPCLHSSLNIFWITYTILCMMPWCYCRLCDSLLLQLYAELQRKALSEIDIGRAWCTVLALLDLKCRREVTWWLGRPNDNITLQK